MGSNQLKKNKLLLLKSSFLLATFCIISISTTESLFAQNQESSIQTNKVESLPAISDGPEIKNNKKEQEHSKQDELDKSKIIDAKHDKAANEKNLSQKQKNDLGASKEMNQSIKDSVDSLFSNKYKSSVFFDEKQLLNIKKAISSFRKNEVFIPDGYFLADQNSSDSKKDTGSQIIQLSRIVYFSPQSWSVQINDKNFNPKKNKKDNELYVAKVDEKSATILWKMRLSKFKILYETTNIPSHLENDGIEVKYHCRLMQNQVCSLISDKIFNNINDSELSKLNIKPSDSSSKESEESGAQINQSETKIDDTIQSPASAEGSANIPSPSNDVKNDIDNKIKDLINNQ